MGNFKDLTPIQVILLLPIIISIGAMIGFGVFNILTIPYLGVLIILFLFMVFFYFLYRNSIKSSKEKFSLRRSDIIIAIIAIILLLLLIRYYLF
jgi:uncharacterized protein (DUF58 family)